MAFVTGAGQGIGLACAEALAEAGAHVVIADRDEGLLGQGANALQAKGYAVEPELVDVTDSARVTRVADDIVARHGGIDILVNNAGIARSETAAEDVTDEHWLNVIDVNLNGTFWCARAFGRHMLAAGKGAIVNIGSMSGFIVNRPQGQSYYNASKAAVHQLTKSLAVAWAPDIRVNAVAPGWIQTGMAKPVFDNKQWADILLARLPMKRFGEPRDLADPILFLCSDAARYVNGVLLTVDGGYSCSG